MYRKPLQTPKITFTISIKLQPVASLMKMKKMKRFLISGLLAGCWAACNSNDYKMYSGEAYIQFSETKDTLQRYSFYFQPEQVTEDTVWFEVITTGYTSSDPRSFKVVQGQIEGQNNAVAGEQYKFLTR